MPISTSHDEHQLWNFNVLLDEVVVWLQVIGQGGLFVQGELVHAALCRKGPRESRLDGLPGAGSVQA